MDFVAARNAQISDAATQLGLTNVNQGRGLESRFWPNLTGAMATRVVDYWIHEGQLATGHVAKIPSSAHRAAWLRAFEVLKSIRGNVASARPHALLPASMAVLVWTSVDGVVFPLRGLADTQTRWEILVESVEEAIAEAGFGLKKLGMVTAVVLGLALAWKLKG